VLGFHVLDVLLGLEDAATSGKPVEIASGVDLPRAHPAL
jgi:hypothetical protein